MCGDRLPLFNRLEKQKKKGEPSMKKIQSAFCCAERFFGDFPTVSYIVLVALWIFWAAQLSGIISDGLREDAEKRKKVSTREMVAAQQRQAEFADERLLTAKRKGASYGPADYFADLKGIEERQYVKSIRFDYFPHFQATQLNQLIIENLAKGYFTTEAMNLAAHAHSQWREDKTSRREGTYKKFHLAGWPKVAADVFLRLLRFYLRSMILAFFLYIVRMAGRDGIRETIRADARRFLLAIFLWPLYIYRYPHNVLREI